MPTSVPYISIDQLKLGLRNCGGSADDATLTSLIQSCSTFLDVYCNRSPGGFLTQTYDELIQGSGDSFLFLNNVPIQSIQRISTLRMPAISIHNTNSDQGSQATVAVTATGLLLTYTVSAVTTSTTLLFVTYPTINDLVVAINALGNHWTATNMSGLATWPSADLRATQGAYGCRIVTAYLNVWWYYLPEYRVNELNGEVYSVQGFSRGPEAYRAIYTAGYTTFPADLEAALVELTVATYYRLQINPNMQSESIGSYSYSLRQKLGISDLSIVAGKTIGHYKRWPVGHFSCW